MAIARNPVLTKSDNLSLLPPRSGTLLFAEPSRCRPCGNAPSVMQELEKLEPISRNHCVENWHLVARHASDQRHDDPLDCVENPARLVANDWNVQRETVQIGDYGD